MEKFFTIFIPYLKYIDIFNETTKMILSLY